MPTLRALITTVAITTMLAVGTIPVCARSAQTGVSAAAETHLLDVAAAAENRQVVEGARITAVADAVVHRLVAGADKTVAPAFAVADQALARGAVVIAAAGSPFVTATYVGVPVAIRVDGRLARTVVAGYRVTTYVLTAVAAHDLAPNTVLEDGDVAIARVASNGRPAIGTGVLLGRKLTAAAPKGAPVYVEATVADTVVRAGEAALLVVHDGPVALTADVVARTGGALGDTVTVFNPQTQRAIAAVVTGRNRVELTLPSANSGDSY